MSTFSEFWEGVCLEIVGIGGLNDTFLRLRYVLRAHQRPRYDANYRRLKRKNNVVGLSECRIPSMFVASVLITIGLFWCGCSAEAKRHWITQNCVLANLLTARLALPSVVLHPQWSCAVWLDLASRYFRHICSTHTATNGGTVLQRSSGL